jgi:ABC-type polysaccharide/polyol phosphate export permease
MGFFWAILMPALIITAGVLVKYGYASLSGKTLNSSDLVGVAVRSVPWAFFVASIRFGSLSLIGNSNLVTKVYMPRAIFPIAAVVSQLMDLCVAAVVLAVLLAFTGTPLTPHILWLPILLAITVVFVTGVAIFLSGATLFFRDVITFAIFFTPVFYDVSMFGKWARVLLLNPLAPLLEGISAVVLGHPLPIGGWVVYSAVVALVAFVGSLALFRRMEPYFAESI